MGERRRSCLQRMEPLPPCHTTQHLATSCFKCLTAEDWLPLHQRLSPSVRVSLQRMSNKALSQRYAGPRFQKDSCIC